MLQCNLRRHIQNHAVYNGEESLSGKCKALLSSANDSEESTSKNCRRHTHFGVVLILVYLFSVSTIFIRLFSSGTYLETHFSFAQFYFSSQLQDRLSCALRIFQHKYYFTPFMRQIGDILYNVYYISSPFDVDMPYTALGEYILCKSPSSHIKLFPPTVNFAIAAWSSNKTLVVTKRFHFLIFTESSELSVCFRSNICWTNYSLTLFIIKSPIKINSFTYNIGVLFWKIRGLVHCCAFVDLKARNWHLVSAINMTISININY